MMFFSEKPVTRSNGNISPESLLRHAETLIREAEINETKNSTHSNYSWLKSRDLTNTNVENKLVDLKPIANKLSSESCATIVFKLDNMSYGRTVDEITVTLKKLIEEQYSIQLMSGGIKRVKERGVLWRTNKVRPELLPPGREATVSFILHSF